ncbi:hypothetical protein [Paracoccus sp. (in: a-proteobacteria)]|uniref:hypothetical protein n=1 Tax=Paracoccus sp. TaxID=267 RepID=UPI00272BF9F9|nr:hypothetical protein [Paracoccus sp. (in: a-proteobacteria)]
MTILTEQGTIIVLGAGSRTLHEARLRRLGRRPEHAVILSPGLGSSDCPPPGWLITGSEATTLLDGWIAKQSGQGEVTCWGAADLQSAHKPSAALLQLFPNLLVLGKRPTRLWRMDELLAELAPLPDPLSLWIDMPGSEAEILSQLLSSGATERLANIWLRGGTERWFEGALDVASLERVAAEGRLTLGGRDLSDPDFPELLFSAPGRSSPEGSTSDIHLSAQARLEKIAILEARIVDLGEDNNALRAKADDQAKMIVSLEAVLAKSVANANEAGSALEALRAEAEQLAAQHEATLSEKQILEARIVDLGEDTSALRAKIEDQARLIAELAAQHEATLSEKQILEARIVDLDEDTSALRAKIEDQARLIAMLEAPPAKGGSLAGRTTGADDERHAQLVGERDASLDRLAAVTEQNETLTRQLEMARDELRRAEGQVRLIRDLLLREVG